MDCFRCIHRLGKALAERAQVTDMVEVIMCHKNSGKRIQVKTILKKRLLEATQAHTRINQDSPIFRTKVIAVAAASSGKTHKLNHRP
jgi:hypothetical protein